MKSLLHSKFYDAQRINTATLTSDRQYHVNIDKLIERRLQVSPAYIDALEQEYVLKGHEGCVNCLEWSSDGRILASGSDDLQIILWDPFRNRRLQTIRTKHLGNMFSVKFLPRQNDSIIATGAADKYIYVYDINHHNESLFSCQCHNARVKRIATAPDSPYVFWSAGEDGSVLQLDMRESHRCRSEENRVRLLNLATYMDSSAEAKCLAINPAKTEQLAVGANDPYARIYDRRMLNPVSSFVSNGRHLDTEPSISKDCVTYFCPGHINKNKSKTVEHESRAITYLTFNATGTELLVNTGAEHIYLYDLRSAEQPVFLSLPEYVPQLSPVSEVEAATTPPITTTTNGSTNSFSSSSRHFKSANCPASSSGGGGSGDASSDSTVAPTSQSDAEKSRQELPEHIERKKKMGNSFLVCEKYLRAIEQYSEAIAMAPKSPVLYLNRATAYMRRSWFGDVYAALRDCHEALRLDPSYIKAHFRLARSLFMLGQIEEASQCLEEMINRFPSYANNHGVLMLHKDIKEARQASNASPPNHDGYEYLQLSTNEFMWRSKAKDYTKRFVGHCNMTTDIKEANYFGFDGNFIVAGSDDGSFYIWEKLNGIIRAIYKADGAIVNCVQPHATQCLMATSGIDHDIKIWTPIAPPPAHKPNLITYVEKYAEDNQQKMKNDPFDLNTRNNLCFNN